MVDGNNRDRGAAGRRKWLPLAIGAAVLLLLLIFGLRSCSDDGTQETAVVPTDPAVTGVAGAGANVSTSGAVASDPTLAGMREYLGGTDAAGAQGRAFGLDRVTFETGSAELDQQDQAVIGEVASVFRDFPNASVTITGYADPAGDAAANKKLAAQRAVAVKQALAGAGLPAAKLMTNVVGETGGAADQENRRVELLVKR